VIQEIASMKDNDNDSVVDSRRNFLRQAIGGAAAATLATPHAFAAWPPGESPEYKGRSNVKDAYEMYTESQYWGEDDVTWWEGRRVGGIAIGVIQLSANIPMIPGNMGNASTFQFPLMYQEMKVTGDMVVSDKPHPEVLRRSIEAGKKLEQQGVRAVVGNCGFFANYQQGIAEALDVPFFGSSLLQIPLILLSLRRNEKLGIITADGPKLIGAPAMENSGLTDRNRVVVYGAEKTSQMKRILATEGAYNPRIFETELVEIAKTMVADHPDIGAILLECTELPPHARAIQKAVGMPVWGFPSMVDWIHAGLVRSSFAGYI
jgi:Asp/Glu/hydantoin racemase